MSASSHENGISIHAVTLHYTVSGVNEEGKPDPGAPREAYEIEFKLNDQERRVGTICFDGDIPKVQGLHGRARFEVDARTGRSWELVPGEERKELETRLFEPRRSDEEVRSASARSVSVHEELTCNWITIR